MSKSRLEWRVGLFVLIGLVLLAALLLEFNKDVTYFSKTYDILMRAENVGGLKPRAYVLISGVQVGTVSDIRLAPNGKTVRITLHIFSQYEVHKDARFVVEQSGFLGDQYVGIIPTRNAAPLYKNGDIAQAEAPFNLQEFTRTASGFITRIDETVQKLNEALVNVSQVVLNPEALTNLSVTIFNLRQFSQDAVTAVHGLNALVITNGPALSVSSSNLVRFSERLDQFGAGLQGVVETNSPGIHVAVENLESSSETLKSLLQDVQAGKGLAGNLLKNEELAASLSQIASNLTVTTSNLNRLGLWGILWKHKSPKTASSAPRTLASPKAAGE